jgi:hypothetical protein
VAKDLRLDVVTSKDSKALAALAVEFEALAKEVDHTGAKMKDSATFSQFLDGQLKKQQATVRALGEEFKRTGSIDVFAQLRNAQKDLKGLERFSKDIAKATSTGIEDGGREGFKLFGADVQGFLSNPEFGPAITAALVGAAVAATPAVGATINAGLLAGVGLGGLAAGVVGQLQDPGVERAFSGVADTAKSVLTESSKAFATPLAGIGEKIQSDLLKAEPRLEKAFDDLAPHLTSVFNGVEGLFKEAAPGFLEALQASGPILDELGQDLPAVGHALSSFFHAISEGEPGARDALHAFLTVTDATVEGLGYLTEGLSKTYTALEALGDFAKGDFGGFAAKVGDLAGHGSMAEAAFKGVQTALQHTDGAVDSAKTDFQGLAQQINATTTNADTLAGAMSGKIFASLTALDTGTLNWYESLNNLKDAIAQNGHALDITTKAGEANREAVLAAVQANIQQYQTNIATGQSATDAAAAYDKNTEALRKQLSQAGFTSTAIDGLIGKYANVPDKVNTTIATEGLTAAINDLDDLIRKLNGLPSLKTITVEEIHRTSGSNAYGYTGHAAGGDFPAGRPILVGEKGPELLFPKVSGSVMPNDALKRLTATQASYRPRPVARASNGNGTLQVAGNADSLLFALLQEAVRVGALQLVAS